MRFFACLLACLFAIHASSQFSTLNKGDKAPLFNGLSHSGEKFQLDSTGTVVLLFYRGYWCPYCNRQLASLNDSISFFESKGAKVVAVTPEKYESVDKTIEKTKASFTIISDTSNQILELYGVDFKVDDKTVERYRNIGIDFSTVNANNENTLPVPAVYIIKEGKISYAWFDKDYRKRPSVSELLRHL